MPRPLRAILAALLLICCMPGRALADLRIITTQHYRIHTDLPDDFALDLAGRMDAMYDEYARRFANFSTPPTSLFDAYLFARRSEYMHFTGDRFPNTGGIFIAQRHQLAAFLETQGRDGMRRTLQHEAFHQFAAEAIRGNPPVWLNEGIAQVFEEGIWTGRCFLIGQVPPARIRRLRADFAAGRFVDFSEFLQMDDRQWASRMRDRTTAAAQYNQAWAMAHFLIYATDDAGRPRFRGRMLDMLHRIHDGAGSQSAFDAAFSPNVDGFQQMFLDWTSRLTPTPEATFAERQAVLAQMVLALRAHGMECTSVELMRRRLDAGGYRLSTPATPAAIAPEASTPDLYFCDLSGKFLDASHLFFTDRPDAPLPDLVCRALDSVEFHTHFIPEGESVAYEVVAQTPGD